MTGDMQKSPFTSRRTILKIILGAFLGLLALIFRPLLLLLRTFFRERNVPDYIPLLSSNVIEDASRMDRTDVAEIWKIPQDLGVAEERLRELVRKASREGLKISVAGSRHSMGGHVIYPNGIVVDTSGFKEMSLNTSENILHVYSGARWSDVISYLDPLGYSVSVMQSNHDFSIGGSLEVNCHGWQSKSAPIASSVDSFRILLSNGEIRTSSREQNSELFAHALGGYGLFGILLDVKLKVVRNEKYRLKRFHQPSNAYAAAFDTLVTKKDKARMAFGRLSVDADRYLTDSMLNVFYLEDGSPSALQKGENDFLEGLTRAIFRSSIGNDFGKRLRWNIESGRYGDFFFPIDSFQETAC